MFDHLGFGATDCAASKSFFLQALQPLGMGLVMEGEHGIGIGPKESQHFGSIKAPANLHRCTLRSPRRTENRFKTSIAQHWKLEVETMAPLACVRITTPTTMARS